MAEGNEERNREQNGRPGGYNGGRRRHHGYRNPNRYNNNAPRQEGERNSNNGNTGNNGNNGNHGQHYRRDFSNKHHEHVKANETLEDIQRDIRRIEKEIEMEISEISAAKLGV